MSYLAKRGSVYYFRRIVPDDLRLALGKREIMLSLRTKDREEAKQLIPAQIIQSDALFASARKAVSAASRQRQAPSAPLVRLKREAVIFESDPASEDQESEIEALEPIMDALAAGKEVHAPPAIIARAARLLFLHEREMADINQEQAIGRLLAHKAKPSRMSEGENQVVDCGSDNAGASGKGVYLDTDIVDLWAAERSPAAKTKDSYRRVAEWLHERIGRKSVEQFTRKDMLAFKDRLLADGQTPQNVNVKLGNLRTLLQWAVDNDHADTNPAMGIVLKAPANKRMTYGLADLQSLFSSPVYANGARPKQGRGEAAYWLPVLALFRVMIWLS